MATPARAALLPLLGGLNEPAQEGQLSFFSLVIGADFVPEDTGPDWVLFRELIPAMRERVRHDTGFQMPGSTHGFIRPAATPGDSGLRDPLTGQPVIVGEATEGSWTPLEFLIRHVERFVRDHLDELVDVSRVREYAERAGAEALERATSDPVTCLEWLRRLREAARGGALGDMDAIANSIAGALGSPGEPVAVSHPPPGADEHARGRV